jgi:beta-lactamase superfamily II metal-dependent hydrolase
MQVVVLNVGQGSCTVLISSDGEVVIVDGGGESGTPGRVDAVEWLRTHGVTRVKKLILSHLHRDHAQGLMHIARELPVVAAVLPYPRFELPVPSAEWLEGFQRNGDVDGPHGQYQLVLEYLTLVDTLQERGASLAFMHPTERTASAALWSPPGYRLVQLFPHPHDRALTPALVHELATVPEAELAAALHELSENTNLDSAIFALEADDASTPTVLIGGDLSEEPALWAEVLTRTDLRGCVWILPHHGAPDGAQPGHIAAIQPVIMIASVSSTKASTYRAHWRALEHELHGDSAARGAETASPQVVATCDVRHGAVWSRRIADLIITVGEGSG